MRTAVGILAAAAAAAAVFTTAGAAASLAAPERSTVTTADAAKRYVRSLGLDPAGFVVQLGRRNYAGPNCPGQGWNCTTATRVIQIVRHEGENTFECKTASDGTNKSTNTCVIVQDSRSGNTARCVIHSTHVPTTEQSCWIKQTSRGGDNRAFVEMVAQQQKGSEQTAKLEATVEQASGSGRNELYSSQTVEQSTKKYGGTVSQDQDGRLKLVVDQTSTSGRQLVQMQQSVDQDAEASGPVLGGSQDQFGDLFGNIDQASAGRSLIQARQKEEQEELAPRGSAVAQSQIGPEFCCTTQSSHPESRFVIEQSASQRSTQGTAFQRERIDGTCQSSGLCNVNQRARNNVDEETNSCTGSFCFIFIDCTSGDEGEGTLVFASRLDNGGGCISGSGGPALRLRP